MKVIDIIYSNLKEGRKSTKREIYYKDPKLFSSQLNSDSAIDTAAALLQIPRNRLNILSAGKGLVAGKISFNENDTLIEVGNRICKIPPDIESINNILIDADYILIIEKDTVLTRLIEEKFFENHNAIAVTGCGYPDLLTREFVRRIIEEFSYLPTFIMTDFDPHGFQILSVYTFGSYKSSGECDSLALPFSH